MLRSILTVATIMALQPAFADEQPPANAQSLSTIVKALESKGYSPITEISIEHGAWEVEAYKDGHPREMVVDAVSGEIISDTPDVDVYRQGRAKHHHDH
ncbi:YpeB-like protein with putative protease inhibitory function [Sinobacterium caligoides]|uniref:YpeB-like protein with putative protease inhibitory function n=1 Tax=Sinobacterium caligoides TaxID=933926 RepID=A0A3N2DEW5_9GAMM|nr:PepSY domain-containing protein [Sinobacterium caligoides]ROR97964.1 YpeB-like protein with putative protease inhibitory function [Sinobacterium caligoides]